MPPLQQRQAAAANPDAPIDAGEFLPTLPASLRQSVLADLEDSQLPSLPADLAAEAQTLRRELEQRNRAVMHERFFGHSNAAITSILRNTANRMGSQVRLSNIFQKMGQPKPLFHFIFGLFKQTIQFYNKSM